jgi:hypothetical protein
MTVLLAPSAYVDFTSPNPLQDVAAQLSSELFGGIPFIGLGEGVWDEVPAMRLAQRFMGLQVELGGNPGDDGGYTLQVESPEFPWHLVAPGGQKDARVDLTGFLTHQLSAIAGVTVSSPIDSRLK